MSAQALEGVVEDAPPRQIGPGNVETGQLAQRTEGVCGATIQARAIRDLMHTAADAWRRSEDNDASEQHR